MKIKEFKLASDKYDIITNNEIIHAIGGGTPELIMEDNSCLIFGSHQLYDEMMSTSGYGDIFKKEFNVDILEQFKLAEDDVAPKYRYRGKEVYEIRLYNPAKAAVVNNTEDVLSALDLVRIFRRN
jgi:hypothetical protein